MTNYKKTIKLLEELWSQMCDVARTLHRFVSPKETIADLRLWRVLYQYVIYNIVFD